MGVHGFSVSEYWVLVAFGFTVSLAVAIYALVRFIDLLISIIRPNEKAEGSEKDIPYSSTVSTTETTDENKPLNNNASEKKLTKAEKRRAKLLAQETKRSSKKRDFGIVIISIVLCFCAFYAGWAFFPNELCFHNFAYNTLLNTPAETNEITNYRFYANYIGTPYYLYSLNGSKEIYVPLISKENGSDETGEYVVYNFYGEESYAKLVDQLKDKYTTVTCRLSVYYYTETSAIKIDHHGEKKRAEKVETYSYSGKFYHYK